MDDSRFLTVLIWIHACAGFTALVVAPIAMVVRKGGDAHRLWGKVFFYAMAVVALTAIIVGVMRPNWLLAMVALFSFQLVVSGYRALYLKRLHEGQRPETMDKVAMGTGILVNGGLLMWGLIHLFLKVKGTGHYVFIIFGAIGLIFVWRDYQRFFRTATDKRAWLYAHMTGFLGGYIATVSAFSVVNLTMIQPAALAWLWPTIIGSPLIMLWVRHYRKKYDEGGRSREMFDIRIARSSRNRKKR
ncbi:MAG TPA: hypothetical protein PK760_07070 [Flavobacteriales bacterium]|nr:hypothetical protein [Flavobacteriales bacterium]